MSFQLIKERFAQGLITKPQFISEMHGLHRLLFDYADMLSATGITNIEISDGAVVMTTRSEGVRVLVDPLDRRAPAIESLNFGDFEAMDCRWLVSLVRDGDVFYDIGANVGWYSCNIAARFPRCVVHAFEPIHRTFENLRANVELNGQAGRVTLNPVALSDYDGELRFHTDPHNPGASTCASGEATETTQTVTCPVTTLDNHFARTELASLDVIKCDVEGAELMVFRGGVKTIAEHKPIVFCEMLRKWSARLGYHPNDIITLFAELGYRCFFATKDHLIEISKIDEETEATNFFFLHPSRMDRYGHQIS